VSRPAAGATQNIAEQMNLKCLCFWRISVVFRPYKLTLVAEFGYAPSVWHVRTKIANLLGFISLTRYHDIDPTFVDITIIATPTYRTILRNERMSHSCIDRWHRPNSQHKRMHALRPTRRPFDKQCRTVIIISTCCLKGPDGQSATGLRRAVTHYNTSINSMSQ